MKQTPQSSSTKITLLVYCIWLAAILFESLGLRRKQAWSKFPFLQTSALRRNTLFLLSQTCHFCFDYQNTLSPTFDLIQKLHALRRQNVFVLVLCSAVLEVGSETLRLLAGASFLIFMCQSTESFSSLGQLLLVRK